MPIISHRWAASVIDALLAKLRARTPIGHAAEESLRSSIERTETIPDSRVFIRRGERLRDSTILLQGWMGRALDLADGKRQLTELHLDGDFVDLHSFVLKQLDHDVVTLSACQIATVPHERIRNMIAQYPELARAFWMSTEVDGAIQRQWTVSVGSRPAVSRVAHLLCELRVRLQLVGRASIYGYSLPLSQDELASCLAVTPVHMNRMLQQLRRRGVIDLERGLLRINNLPELHSIAGFDPSYLYISREGFSDRTGS